MTVKAIFRAAEFAVTTDNAPSVGQSAGYSSSYGMLTPNATFNKNRGLQRIDTIAQETATPTIAAAATYTVSLASLTAASRTLIRVQGPTNFTVSYTPNGGSAVELDVVGSAYHPGLLEMHVEDVSALTVENTGSASAAFTIAVANIVDYDDGQIEGDYPPSTEVASGTNSTLAAGFLPLGAIIPVAGTFTAANNTGTYSEALITPMPSWLKECDGTIVSDTDSVMFGRYVPNLTDDRFLMGAGSTAAGVVSTLTNERDFRHTHTGGTTGVASVNTTTRTTAVAIASKGFAATSGNASVNTTTRTTSVAISDHTITQPTFTVDAHTHNIAHVHIWTRYQASTIDYYTLLSADSSRTTIETTDTVWTRDLDVGAGPGISALDYVNGFNSGSNASFYTGGVMSPPAGTAGSGATSATASVNTTTRTTAVALTAHSITQPVFTVDAHTHTTTTNVAFTSGEITQPTFTVDAHTHAFNTTAATWTSGSIGSATDIRPKWFASKFYMRIK